MKVIKAALLGAIGVFGALFLSGCVTTYPYQTAFDACDVEAGACYRYCEESGLSEGEYASCHADCEVGANRCFADAYDRYSYNRSAYNGSYYAPSWPWYGRYGAWGPSSGYYFGFNYSSGYGNYRRPYYGDRYYDGGHGYDRRRKKDRRRKDGDGGGAYAPPPGSPAANNPNRPRQMPNNRGATPAPRAPVQSAPTQSTPPPAAAPRQQQPVRSKPSSKSRHKSGTPRSKERPRDY